jgi:hypothetical protein
MSASTQTTVPAAEGEANAGAVLMSSDADVVGATASEGSPRWSSVDEDTADLLSLVAGDKIGPWADEEWSRFTQALEAASDLNGRIDPNFLRPLLRGSVAPNRIGAFTNRAKAEGLIAWDGEWVTSDDREGKNSGKPTRVYRYLGT